MSTYSSLAISWWSWWSNPTIRLHVSHRTHAHHILMSGERPDYLRLLEIRSLLDIPELPDQTIESNPAVRAFALADQELMNQSLKRFSVMALDSSILRFNSSDWDIKLHIRSQEEIREIIQLWNDVPAGIKLWGNGFLRRHTKEEIDSLNVERRILLGAAVYLASFYPSMYKRWALTIPYDIVLLIDDDDLLPQDMLTVVEDWIEIDLKKMDAAIQTVHTNDIPDLTLEGADLDSSLFQQYSPEGI